MKKPILAALALCYALGAAAQTPDTAAPEGYRFTDVKILPVTPVKDQSRSGTCWRSSKAKSSAPEVPNWTFRRCGSCATSTSKRP